MPDTAIRFNTGYIGRATIADLLDRHGGDINVRLTRRQSAWHPPTKTGRRIPATRGPRTVRYTRGADDVIIIHVVT